MSRLKVTIAASALALGVSAPVASAAVPVGNCTLHAYQPSHYRGNWYGRGNIDNCFTFHDQSLALQVCTRYIWRGAGYWRRGGCLTIWHASGFWLGTYRAPLVSPPQTIVPHGTTYYVQTWDYGCAGGKCRAYTSSPARG